MTRIIQIDNPFNQCNPCSCIGKVVQAGINGTVIIRNTVIQSGQVPVFLRFTNKKCGDGFPCGCPVPDAVSGKCPEILFQCNFPIFKYDESFFVLLLKKGI